MKIGKTSETKAGCAADIARLEEKIALLEAVIENFPGGIMVTGRDLEVVLCNGQQRQMLDYPETLFVNGNPSLRELFHFNAARGEYGPGRVADLVREKMQLVRQRVPHVFERTRPTMAAPFVWQDKDHQIGASLGVALSSGDASEAQDLMRKADQAMYRAKTEGGSGFRFHGPARGALATIS